jgi:hypothetical protein
VALDVESAIGATELAGTKVNKRGFGASLGGSAAVSGGGPLVDAISSTVLQGVFRKKARGQKAKAAVSSAPDFGRLGYLAVTAEDIVLIKLDATGLKVRLGEVLARVPRGEIAAADFESSAMYASGVTITFASGDQWLLEAPRPTRKAAQELVQLLNG